MKRRDVLTFGAAIVVATALGTSAFAADWVPQRPINIIVPYSAGGGVDTYARGVAVGLQEKLGVPIVIVNKPGAGGITGSAEAAAARPDGYTLILSASGAVQLSSMFRDAPINPIDNFESIAQIGALVFSVAVPADSPFQTGADLIAAAKANPGSLRWAHGGRGSTTHISGQSLLNLNNTTATDIAFKGGAKVRAAIIGGQVDFGIVGVQQSFGFEEQLRIIGVSSETPYPLAPDLPTFASQGIESGNIGSPVQVFAPLGTPADVIATVSDALRDVTLDPAFAELMKPKGLSPIFATGADANAALEALRDGALPIISVLKAGN